LPDFPDNTARVSTANILIVESEEEKLNDLQKGFYQAVESLEKKLVTTQMDVFKTWRRTQMDEYRAKFLSNGMDPAFVHLNTAIMKKMDTLSDYEKCRLVYEYHTYTKFKIEWTSVTRGISDQNQRKSFDSFLKSYIKQFKDQVDENTVDIDMDRIKSW
jgi:hypothetical protein